MKLFFYLFPLFFFLQLLSASAEILVAPNAQTVLLGTDAHFFCSGSGAITRWIINDTLIFKGDTDADFISRGFQFEEVDLPSEQMHNLSMTVVASQMNNNTKIQCGTFRDTVIVSNPVFLTIIGSPVPVPGVRLEVFNATALLFHWDQPFSWENYPILQYNVSLVNTSDGENLRDELYPNTTNCMIHQIPQLEQVCAELLFTITAANDIGKSEASGITGGYPIAPGPFQSAIQTNVVFMSDGTPVVEILFKPPPVCSYQLAEYTIVITNIKDEIIFTIGPNSYSPGYGGDFISEVTSRNLEMDKLYSVAVTVETRAGAKTITAEFDTDFQPPAPPTEGVQNKNEVSLVIIIAASVGGACLFAILGITTLLVCVFGQRRRMRSRRVLHNSSSRPPMVTNPIYEGVVYESIDEEKFRSVTDTSSPVSTEEFPQFPSNRSSQEYENTKKLADSANVASDPSASALPNEDNYTFMNPAGKPDQNPDNERSHLPSNDTLRYGPEPVTAV